MPYHVVPRISNFLDRNYSFTVLAFQKSSSLLWMQWKSLKYLCLGDPCWFLADSLKITDCKIFILWSYAKYLLMSLLSNLLQRFPDPLNTSGQIFLYLRSACMGEEKQNVTFPWQLVQAQRPTWGEGDCCCAEIWNGQLCWCGQQSGIYSLSKCRCK